MGTKSWLGTIGVMTLLTACGSDGTGSVAPGSPGYRPIVGEVIGDGRVTQVSGGSCQAVVISYDSKWDCSAEQLAAIQVPTNLSPPGVGPADTPSGRPKGGRVPPPAEGPPPGRRPGKKRARRKGGAPRG